MQIAKLCVRIGNQEEIIEGCDDQNPDVAQLLRAATSLSAVITIEVDPGDEEAAALGRLVFGRPKLDTSRIASIDDQLPNLSKKLSKLGLPAHLVNRLREAGITYLWQVAEKSEAELLKIKGFGRMSLDKVKRILESLGLRPGMDLSSIKNRLPT